MNPTKPLCAGRVCAVTGAGNGLGRAYARMLAAHGAKVVVNDIGGSVRGDGASSDPAHAVVEEIRAAGGEAVAHTDDITTWDGAAALVDTAVDAFGCLDVLVNNAGILRDRTIVKLEESDWDDVVRVHLKGTFATTRFAAAHWKARAAAGEELSARLINTTSVSGLFGNFGQANYAAAKAGVAAFTLVASMELAKLGVTANAISPGALTRMTEGLRGEELTEQQRAERSPDWVAAVVTWLASVDSAAVNGRVVLSSGRRLGLAEGWIAGECGAPVADPIEVGEVLSGYVARARANADLSGAVA